MCAHHLPVAQYMWHYTTTKVRVITHRPHYTSQCTHACITISPAVCSTAALPQDCLRKADVAFQKISQSKRWWFWVSTTTTFSLVHQTIMQPRGGGTVRSHKPGFHDTGLLVAPQLSSSCTPHLISTATGDGENGSIIKCWNIWKSHWVAKFLTTVPRKPGSCDQTVPPPWSCKTVWCARLHHHQPICRINS